jgi:hypothetical protein
MSERHITWFWRDRKGRKHEITSRGATFADARVAAIKSGYPGHRGGWWNWFVDDSHTFLSRFGGCKQHDGNCNIHRTGIFG